MEKQENIEEGIDLYGTYDENDLYIEEVPTIYEGVEINIPTISGLKDKIIEEKINSDMQSKVLELVKSCMSRRTVMQLLLQIYI